MWFLGAVFIFGRSKLHPLNRQWGLVPQMRLVAWLSLWSEISAPQYGQHSDVRFRVTYLLTRLESHFENDLKLGGEMETAGTLNRYAYMVRNRKSAHDLPPAKQIYHRLLMLRTMKVPEQLYSSTSLNPLTAIASFCRSFRAFQTAVYLWEANYHSVVEITIKSFFRSSSLQKYIFNIKSCCHDWMIPVLVAGTEESNVSSSFTLVKSINLALTVWTRKVRHQTAWRRSQTIYFFDYPFCATTSDEHLAFFPNSLYYRLPAIQFVCLHIMELLIYSCTLWGKRMTFTKREIVLNKNTDSRGGY